MRVLALAVACFASCALGCDEGASSRGDVDASIPDSAEADSSAPDGVGDASVPDSAEADTSTPDVGVDDMVAPDSAADATTVETWNDATDVDPGRVVVTTIVAVKRGEVPIGSRVSIADVQVAFAHSNFFTVQTQTNVEYGGLYVYVGNGGDKPSVGQLVDLTGTLANYEGQIQLIDSTYRAHPLNGNGVVPVVVAAADIVPGGAKAAAYEAMYVEVQGVTVVDTAPVPQRNGAATENVAGEFSVSGDLRVDDLMYRIEPPPIVGERFFVLRGLLRHTWNRNKLLPRRADDVRFGLPVLLGLAPGSVVVVAGSTVELTLSYSRPSSVTSLQTPLSDNPSVATVPQLVEVPIGAVSATFTLTAIAPGTTVIRTTDPAATTTQVTVLPP